MAEHIGHHSQLESLWTVVAVAIRVRVREGRWRRLGLDGIGIRCTVGMSGQQAILIEAVCSIVSSEFFIRGIYSNL